MERLHVEPHALWLPNEIMDKDDHFCSVGVSLGGNRAQNRAHRRKHRHNIADASQTSSKTLAMDHPNHPQYYHI